MRPTYRPAIVQILDEHGRVVHTAYVLPADPLPDYPVAKAVAKGITGKGPGERRWGWLVAGGTGVVASTTLYALAARSAARFAGPLPADFDRDELVALRNETNLLVAGSAVSGGVGAIAFTAFVVRW
jgi:hypothetical protein